MYVQKLPPARPPPVSLRPQYKTYRSGCLSSTAAKIYRPPRPGSPRAGNLLSLVPTLCLFKLCVAKQMGHYNLKLLVVVVVCVESLLSLCFSSSLPNLSPPPGNSLSIKAKTLNGFQLYRCIDGDWVMGSAYATLLDYDTDSVVGNYSTVKNVRVPKHAGTWTYRNNEGDRAESGSAFSVVTGKEIAVASCKAELDLQDYLAIASSHANEGALALVSYISRVNSKGGAKVDEGYCEVEHKVIKVPFQAEFHFWKQDLLPPAVPYGLTLGLKGRPIQAFYGTGLVTYVFDSTKQTWVQRKVSAKMYDVPGGTAVGSYFTRSTADYKGGSFCWQVDSPNGFTLVGKPASSPLLVTPGCLPWSLDLITSSSGNSTMLGRFTYVQTVSTMGGLPPTIELLKKPQKGSVWRSYFSAIYWFYCSI